MMYVIIVLYKIRLEDSITYKTFKRNVSKLENIGVKLLIYNNSPEIIIPQSEEYYLYQPKENLKLAGAYRYALERAYEEGYKWLLLLDQDTELTSEYFEELNKFLNSSIQDSYDIAVPILKQGNLFLSPACYNKYKGPFDKPKVIHNNNELSKKLKNDILVAYNSVSLLKVSALKEVGGFGTEYPLDMLDYDYYTRMHNNKSYIYILSTIIQQNLSLLDKKNPISVVRYNLYMDASYKFAKSLGWTSVLYYKYKLVCRVVSQSIRPYTRGLVLSTIKHFFKI